MEVAQVQHLIDTDSDVPAARMSFGRGGRSGAQATVAFLFLDSLRAPDDVAGGEVALCALGLAADETHRLLARRLASREDESAWRTFLDQLRVEGVGATLSLICCSGRPEVVRAIRSVYPHTPIQVSLGHRLLAFSRTVAARRRAACLTEARQVFRAPDRATAVTRFRAWRARWLAQGELAVRSLEADLGSCLTFYRFPAHLRGRLRSLRLVRQAFRSAPAFPGGVEVLSGRARVEPPNVLEAAGASGGPRAERQTRSESEGDFRVYSADVAHPSMGDTLLQSLDRVRGDRVLRIRLMVALTSLAGLGATLVLAHFL